MDTLHQPPSSGSFSVMKKRARRLGIFLLVVIAGFLIWSVRSDTKTFSTEDPIIETNAVLRKLREVLLVPDETPFVARIANVEELQRTQDFYRDAKNGHYIIVYQSIARAIIFDAENMMIINIGPVTPRNER
ncbi:MAG: hypothetical protein Q8P93_02595 [bacterium]|nr:hypothetical protein [bacterium]